MANPYVNKVIVNDQIKLDLTGDTVTAETLMQGYTAHDASGAPIVGTASGGGGDILGHKFVAGSFTLAADTTSNYTILSANDLFNEIKDDFPGATRITDYFYPRAGEGSTAPVNAFLAGICWLDEIDHFDTTLNAKEWIASFLPKHSVNNSNNTLAYADSYGYFAARSGGSNGLKIDNNGAKIGFSSNYKGFAGRRYKYLIYVLDHGVMY